jgi:hypothetical protein
MSEVPPYVAERILAAIEEGRRLRSLSNDDLVREHRRLSEAEDDELLIQEFYTRLSPEWDQEDL